MPELPEVETTRLGLAPLVIGKTIREVSIRERRLRWPVQLSISDQLQNQSITDLSRRGKYLLISTTGGTLLLHLGMSGNLRYLAVPTHPSKHDHIDFEFSSGELLRFNDPRRFGSLHFSTKPDEHWLLKNMGPEPLGPDFGQVGGGFLGDRMEKRYIAATCMLGHTIALIGIAFASSLS